MSKPRLPTDRQLLDDIYARYYDEFAAFDAGAGKRNSKVYVPVDVAALAREYGVDGDIVFGRLYYHLDRKYGYTHDDGSKVHLFSLVVGADRHCVNFPYLAAILAGLREEDKRYRRATITAIVSLGISLVSLGITLFRTFAMQAGT